MLVFPECHWCKSLAAIISFVRRPEIEGGGEESLQYKLHQGAVGRGYPNCLNLLSFLTRALPGSFDGQICIGWPRFTHFQGCVLRNLPNALIGVHCSRSPRKKKKSNKCTPGQHSGNYFISCDQTAYLGDLLWITPAVESKGIIWTLFFVVKCRVLCCYYNI